MPRAPRTPICLPITGSPKAWLCVTIVATFSVSLIASCDASHGETLHAASSPRVDARLTRDAFVAIDTMVPLAIVNVSPQRKPLLVNDRPGFALNGVRDGLETDVDCGGPTTLPRCEAGKACREDRDCEGACSYAGRCVEGPSCKPHLGGDTCGQGEVGEPSAAHESCCRTLPVRGFRDPLRPSATVYLDKYEITAGRIRAFLTQIALYNEGKPNVRGFIEAHRPLIWDDRWTRFLPSDHKGGTVHVDRRLLGDPRRYSSGAPVPDEDQAMNTGTDYQFGTQLFVYVHGHNCSTLTQGSYGFPTFFYPPEVLTRTGTLATPPRADGFTREGVLVPAAEHLDVKAINCISNAMLAAFCHWDGGQLATSEVLDYVTDSPPSLGNAPGCGSQVGDESPPATARATRGGRCADLDRINATYDAGSSLPYPGSPLNENRYVFPLVDGNVTHDKAWQVAAPGRAPRGSAREPTDTVRLAPNDEPWLDLAGNLNESVLTTVAGQFSGKFGLKFRGLGYQSARSELNVNTAFAGEGGVARIERAEARAAFTGGRCMRFR
jgi:hypothetical protein